MPQASVPSPRTWSPGDFVLAPRLRADVSDAVAFLSQRPLFIGQNTAGSSWSSGSDNTLGLNTELADTWNGHSPLSGGGALSSQYFAQAPGWYLCRCAPVWNYTSATQSLFAGGFTGQTGGSPFSTVRGALLLNGSTHPLVAQCADLIEQTVTGPVGGSGDYIQPTALNYSGSAVNLENTSTLMPTVSIRWVCATSGTQPLPVPPLATVPNPITSAWLNANVRDTIGFLIYPPACKATYAAGSSSLPSQAFPAGSVVPLNSVTLDNYGAFTTGSGAGYTAPVAGSYFCYGQFNLAASTASTGYCAGFSVNGGTTQWGDSVYKLSDTTGGGATVTKRLRLNAGDEVQLIACQGSGSSISYNGSGINQTRAIFVWDGA